MDLQPYVDNIQHQLVSAAEAGGEDARVLAVRLTGPLDSALRLTLQDVLALAAEEITTELAPGSVELRLRGRDPEFVVTLPAGPESGSADADDDADDWQPMPMPMPPREPVDGDEGGTSRINLRMPDHLKSRIEAAANGEGLSVNSWLIRAASSALDRTDPDRNRGRRAARGSQRYTGWVR